MDLERSIRDYLYGDSTGDAPRRGPLDRYASFDYCFNYFQAFRESGSLDALTAPEHLEVSCLHLGFYLASWGMLRGSASLLQHSAAVYEPVVRVIASTAGKVWAIDVHCYTGANRALLLQCSEEIRTAFGGTSLASDILVTKVMLGVFGNVPAFDTYVCTALRKVLGVRSFGERSLAALAGFYDANREVVERYRVPTLDFATGQDTQRRYTRAKVLDMALFIEGQRLSGTGSE
jgi:hypothetical protein